MAAAKVISATVSMFLLSLILIHLLTLLMLFVMIFNLLIIRYTGSLANFISPGMTHLTMPCCAQHTLCTEHMLWLVQVTNKAWCHDDTE